MRRNEMAVKTKRAVVSKKVSNDALKNNERWTFFLSQCKVEWDNLSDNSKDFFMVMGNTESSEEDINNAMDLARGVK
jgi:hypothetical protein